jgi:hypothetical protein
LGRLWEDAAIPGDCGENVVCWRATAAHVFRGDAALCYMRRDWQQFVSRAFVSVQN